MIKVKVREGEPVDRALKRLKKKLKDSRGDDGQTRQSTR